MVKPGARGTIRGAERGDSGSARKDGKDGIFKYQNRLCLS